MNMSKLKVDPEEAKTTKLRCRGLIVAHFEQALVDQQIDEILNIL